jgi:hypothetical protein
MITTAWRLSGYDLRAFARNRQSRFFTLALPVLFLVIFASVSGGRGHTTEVAGGRISTSLIRDEDAALPATMAFTLPLYFISGVFVAIPVLPRWLADVGEIFPVRHLADALLVACNPHTTGLGFAGTRTRSAGRCGTRLL